ncbi:MAG: hypothetical protein IT223_08385 [Crocinitomicaceae bacterium]|nr:hypothetical protein [Crocinitomicaceae bacterium]
MKLIKGEAIIFEDGASHFHNFLAIGGTLVLTNKRLLFTSSPCFHYRHELEIPVDQISGIEYFKTVFLNPNGLAILLKNGNLENFIVDDKKIWGEKVMTAVGQFV